MLSVVTEANFLLPGGWLCAFTLELHGLTQFHSQILYHMDIHTSSYPSKQPFNTK